MKKTSIAALLFLTISASAIAAEWEVVSAASTISIEIDKASIVQQKAGVRKAWSRFWRHPLQQTPDGQQYSRLMQLSLYNCNDRTIGVMQRHFFNDEKSDSSVESNHFSPKEIQFDEVIPDSHGDVILNFVCSAKIAKK